MKQFGLIGKTLHHSFSKKYFTEKFKNETIEDASYELFELESIRAFPDLIKRHKASLAGLNVTIPYKREVMQFLDDVDERARIIDAVNTIKFEPNGKIIGYNTDYDGFKDSIMKWNVSKVSALILGTGGASGAVKKVLEDLSIEYKIVSRSKDDHVITYKEIEENPEIIRSNRLIVNTTPLGTFPNIEDKPNLPYNQLSSKHMLFDLVYNPEISAFLQEGVERNAHTRNGYDMLVGQAEASWSIWNS